MYIVWRWSIEATYFEPKVHWQIPVISCVYAGVDKYTWSMLKGEGVVLHRIELTYQQASDCMVAETCYDWDDDWEGLRERDYMNSLVPLTEYKGDYNKPEVLIPFRVGAEVVSDRGIAP